MIVVESKRKKLSTLERDYPGAVIVDVTSHATGEMVRFSPFYPHGGIPVPYSGNITSMSVEGIWQGLKVFGTAGVDRSCFRNATMKDLKRTTRRFGPTLGHRKGVDGTELLGYLEARKLIYLPSYQWVLDHKLAPQLEKLRLISKSGTLVLLDYETNGDVSDPRKPLSHASLIKAYLEGNYPECGDTKSSNSEGTVATETAAVEPSISGISTLTTGMRVRHQKFGEGTVTAVDPAVGRVTVDFDEEGIKTLAVRLAKLEIIK